MGAQWSLPRGPKRNTKGPKSSNSQFDPENWVELGMLSSRGVVVGGLNLPCRDWQEESAKCVFFRRVHQLGTSRGRGGDRGFNISSERFFLVGKTDFPIGSNHQLWKMACKVGLEIC